MFVAMLVALASVLAQTGVQVSSSALSGRVVDEGTGAPVAGATVTLFSMAPPMPGRAEPERPITTTTDHDGRFSFATLSAGRYMVAAEKPGYARPVPPARPPVVTITANAPASLQIVLQKGGVIVGRVLDPHGEPLANAYVQAMRRAPLAGHALPQRMLGPMAARAQTNDLGEFRLFGLAPGEYFVAVGPNRPVARGTSRATLLPTFYPGTIDGEQAEPIALRAGETSADVVVQVVAAPTYRISGIVTDDAGEAVSDAMVRLADAAPAGPGMEIGERSTRTDANGAFELAGLTSGTHTLLAIAPVVIARAPGAPSGTGSGSYSSYLEMGVSGKVGGGITTETRNGVTSEYRDDAATRMTVTVADADAIGVRIVVRRRQE